MRNPALIASLIVLAAAAASGSAGAQAPARQCFRMSQMESWRPGPDDRSFYMRVGVRDVYRVELASACPRLRSPGVHLVTKPTSDLICSALDFDLRVADNTPPSIPTPCIVSGFTRLTPDELQALPKKLKP